MKNCIFSSFTLLVVFLLFQYCKKPVNTAQIVTIGVNKVGIKNATAYGRITGLEISSKGFCWDMQRDPSIDNNFSDEGKGSEAFSSSLSGLLPNTTYYLRAYAKNAAGIVYGDVVRFQTLIEPLVSTNTATFVNYNLVTAGGSVNNSGFAIIESGICYDTQTNPDINKNRVTSVAGSGNFDVALTNLNEKTVYYYKAYAKYSFATYYGAEKTFTTGAAPLPIVVFTNTGTVTDYDGNTYKTITIGNQTWMAENLRVTTYNDGSAISYYPVNSSTWPNLFSGAYGYYNSSFSNINAYGFLYNYFTIEDVRGLPPAGWHIPTNAEWQTLINTVANANATYSISAIQQLFATNIWSNINCAINNYSNMSLKPAGYRSIQGGDSELGLSTGYWTMDNSGSYASIMYFDYNCFMMSTSKYKNCGYSIRCVKD